MKHCREKNKNSFSITTTLFLVLMAPLMLALTSASTFAAHDPSASMLAPEWSPASSLVDYTVTIDNAAAPGDPIDEVRIIKNDLYTTFDCEDVLGWTLIEVSPWFDGDIGLTEMCWYFTLDPLDNIPGGSSMDFLFEATTPSNEDCDLQWKFETRDEESAQQGDWESVFVRTGVDSTEPEFQKMVFGKDGELWDLCPNGPAIDEECWITEGHRIEFWVEDPGAEQCEGSDVPPSGLDYCEVSLILDGEEGEGFYFNGEWHEGPSKTIEFDEGVNEYHFNVSFGEDSVHDLSVVCYDRAGNAFTRQGEDNPGVDTERFRVDTTPPTTLKTYEGPVLFEEGQEWVDGITTAVLEATDGGLICAIGVDKTYYRLTNAKDEMWCDSISNCEDWLEDGDSDSDWEEYTGPISISNNLTEDGCTIIEFFSVDELGNEEEVKVQCPYVDLTPPSTTKEMLDKKWYGECPPEPGASPEESQCFITSMTEIGLWCDDMDEDYDHQSGHEVIKWRYRFTEDGINWSEWNPNDACAGDIVDGWCTEETEEVTVSFPESSRHQLEWYCEDAVEKKSEVDVEYFHVDNDAPTFNKTVIGPQVGDCPPEPGSDDECYIKGGETIISITADDGDSIHASHGVHCYWNYTWNGSVYQGEHVDSEDFPIEIIFEEDSEHILSFICEDRLWNYVMDVETFLVDIEPPVTTKEYGEPFFNCYDWCEYDCALDEKIKAGEACVGDECDDLTCEEECVIDMCGGEDYHGHLYPQWINHETPITLETWDEKVGTDYTEKRVTLVPDEMCEYAQNCYPCYDPVDIVEGAVLLGDLPVCNETGEFELYNDSFVINEESCHLIEYFSTDLLGNVERVQWQCTYIDTTPPTWNKTVGEPSIFIGEGGDEICEEEERPDASGATVDPDMLDTTLAPGETVLELKRITTDEVPFGNLDVVFLFDLTGSMDDDLAEIQSQATNIMNDVKSTIPNAAFGVGSFMDYTETYDFCGYDSTYGDAGSGDYPYSQDQDITTNTGAVATTISSLSTGFGVDGPEAYARALWESQFFDWRSGSRKVVVIFEDNVPHDCNLGSYGCSDSTTGTDPGPDGVAGTADDLPVADVIQDLKDAGISVVVIEADFGECDGVWQEIADETGGIFAEVGFGGDLADEIVTLIEDVTGTVSELTLMPKTGYEEWVSWEPDSYLEVEGNTTVEFNVTVGPPEGTAAGEYHFWLKIMGDGSVLAIQDIWINVTGNITAGNTTTNQTCGDGLDWMVTKDTPIHLSCNDPEPHPVGHEELCFRVGYEGDYLTEEYCEEYSGEMEGDWCCVGGDLWFNFQEDSEHELEFVCFDALGNEGETDLEYFAVETVPPVTTKTYLEPFHQKEVCLDDYPDYTKTESSEGGEECWIQNYIDTASRIQLDAEDPNPHPSGVDETYYRWSLVPDEYCMHQEVYCQPCDGDDCGDFQVYEEPFGIDEESCHVIEYYSVDKLGNEELLNYQCTYVDKTPPETYKEYNESTSFSCRDWCTIEHPFDEGAYLDCVETMCWSPEDSRMSYPFWIAPTTDIWLFAEDQEPHPSGVDNLQYRVTRVNDSYCEQQEVCKQEAEGEGDWSFGESFEEIAEAHFIVGEESCHLIEYFAVDNVNKTEEPNKQCVYVDGTAPAPNKTVGEPHDKIYPEDYVWNFYPEVNGNCWQDTEGGIDCWEVSLLTPISLSCNDPEPHPVGHETVCFNVEMDGDDITEDVYCELYDGYMADDGYCCIPGGVAEEFYFNEISEHNLKFYCKDAVGNVGEIDDEKFKVEDDAFRIWLNKKWNLVSVPVNLIDDSMDEIFEDIADDVISVTSFDATTGEWFIYTPEEGNVDTLTTLVPGRGYWILMADDAELVIGGSLLRPGAAFPSVPLKGDAWNLIGYYGTEGLDEYHGPVGNGGAAEEELCSIKDDLFDFGWTSLVTYWEPDNPDAWYFLSSYDNMDPGAGYWVFVTQDGQYAFNTACGGIALPI